MNTLEGALKRTSGISIVLSVSLIIFGSSRDRVAGRFIDRNRHSNWVAGVICRNCPSRSRLSVRGHRSHRLEARGRGFLHCGRSLLDRAPGSGRGGLNSRTGNIPVRGRCGGRGRLFFCAQKWCFTLDAAGWNRHSRSRFHDLESVARGVPVGNRDTGRHQHDHDRYHSSDDGSGSS